MNTYAEQFVLPLTGKITESSVKSATILQGSYIITSYQTSMNNSKKDLNKFSLKEQESKK